MKAVARYTRQPNRWFQDFSNDSSPAPWEQNDRASVKTNPTIGVGGKSRPMYVWARDGQQEFVGAQCWGPEPYVRVTRPTAYRTRAVPVNLI